MSTNHHILCWRGQIFLVSSDIYFPLHSAFQDIYGVLTKQHFQSLEMHHPARICEQHIFSILFSFSFESAVVNVCPICKNLIPVQGCMCILALSAALYNNKSSCCCLNANKSVSERSNKPDLCDYCSSGSTQIDGNRLP